ncbi:MAG: phosphoribosylformylglycinamidine synthase subunit PurQ, partial [Bacteroidales bacterium]|nr:phosphoribosylformylglycinamidine synthase subunit PurQ [Bacteroidales bacterium]
MQKRAYNAIRAISEKEENTIISVHDHGAGGHLNCLSELVEELGGNIDIEKLPIGDPTLSAKEIIGNESQERMGLVMKEENVEELHRIAERERAPFYVIGETTGKHNFTLKNNVTGETPIDLELSDMFGSTPKTVMTDESPKGGADGKGGFKAIDMDVDALTPAEIETQIAKVLSLESVACKDWLTNKVDRSVTGLIACQQTCGEIQLPLNNLGVTAIGYQNKEGIATSIGHAPMAGLIDPAAGSRIAISEALTNMVWTPIKENLTGVSLSANWMWPCKNDGENARLYSAVKGASDFAIALGVNIPTGKDSMSMTQKYPNGDKVLSPGTVIISTVGESEDVYATIHPVVQKEESTLYYIPFTSDRSYPLGGSAFAQTIKKVGAETADVKDPEYFKSCFNTLQDVMFRSGNTPVLAGHDVSAGGLATTLLEMCFANVDGGLDVDLTAFDSARILFSEVPAVVVQVKAGAEDSFVKALGNVAAYKIGKFAKERCVNIALPGNKSLSLDIDKMRDVWFETSYLFDVHQVGKELAKERYTNYKNQPLQYSFPAGFTGKYNTPAERKHTAAIIREKGSNGDREMAWALYMAGFNVKDVHMTDLITGRETLEDVNMIVFVGGFSNADTLGSAKGWAGAFQYNEKAKKALENFYSRKDT